MILVTGATGFLGSEVVRQLTQQNKPVVALKRPTSVIPTAIGQLNIDWRNADLLNFFELQDALEDVTHVFHCAARVSFDPSEKKEIIRINTEGTANIANICMDKGIRVVHVSSVAAVGESKNGRLITEKDHWAYSKDRTSYSVSKYESEMEIWRAIAEGLNAVIVNPSIIIGKNGGVEGSGKIFETVKKGLRFYPTGGCGLVDVEDVAKIMISLMDSSVSGERYILNAENWSFRDLFSKIAHELNVAPPSIRVSSWMLKLAAGILAVGSAFRNQRFELTSETAKSASRKPLYSNQKIREVIGYQFKPVEQTIIEVCQNLKQ